MQDSENRPASDVAFTPAVKAIQERLGSRRSYEKMERGRGWGETVTDDLASFIAERDSLYLGTASADGQPYIQHRGGKPGFLKVIDEKRWASPTSSATGSTSRWATSRKTRRRSSS